MRLNLWRSYKEYYSHGQPILKYAYIVSAISNPVFYGLQMLRTTHPYDSLVMRATATLMCVVMALRSFWPQNLQRFYLPCSYFVTFFCLPFFYIFVSLKNNGGVVSVANTYMMVFFLILLTDWRNTVAMLLAGAGSATVCYLLTTPAPGLPVDYLGRLPVLVVVIIGGSLFKFTQKQIQAESVDAVTALAGSIAHEMRNPLGRIKHSLETMQSMLPLPSAGAGRQTLGAAQLDDLFRHLAQGEMAVKRGLQVIAMTLDEVSSKPLDTAGFSFLSAAEVTEKAVEEYGHETEEARSKVRVVVIEDFHFRGDETAYLFMLFNLMKNALYYLPLNPSTTVTLIVERYQVRVRDTGPGIAPELLPNLFEPFRSVGKSGGTGLGLAYCKRVMQSFGGEISCESVLGQYTQWTMRFPPIDPHDSEALQSAMLAKALEAFEGRRILVVDDDAALRATMHHKLQPLKAQIDDAADGQRALEVLARQRYDLVLLDLNMPVMDGYAVAEKIRQDRNNLNHATCIVAYSSEPAHVARVKTQKAGVDGFISKPCPQLPLIQAMLQAYRQPASRLRPEAAMLTGRTILIADDSPYNRKAVAAYLKQAGVHVVEVGHGRAALVQLESLGQCDALLLDINMPGMNGLETAAAIRQGSSPWRRIPIIALTANSDQATVDAAFAAGMNDFITKPVEVGLLYETLRRHVDFGKRLVRPQNIEIPKGLPEQPLLNLERLESYERIGMLEELLNDYLPEIARLIDRLERAVLRHDLHESLEALHSLVGMSGEAGAMALYKLARAVYEPMREDKQLPTDDEWMGELKALAGQTDQALRAYGAGRSQVDPA